MWPMYHRTRNPKMHILKKCQFHIIFGKGSAKQGKQCICGADCSGRVTVDWTGCGCTVLWWLMEDCTWDLLSPLSTQDCTCCLCQWPDALLCVCDVFMVIASRAGWRLPPFRDSAFSGNKPGLQLRLICYYTVLGGRCAWLPLYAI